MPTPRSGHSFTHIGGVNYLLYGGIDNSKKAGGKILPNNDVFQMKIGSSKLTDISAHCRQFQIKKVALKSIFL